MPSNSIAVNLDLSRNKAEGSSNIKQVSGTLYPKPVNSIQIDGTLARNKAEAPVDISNVSGVLYPKPVNSIEVSAGISADISWVDQTVADTESITTVFDSAVSGRYSESSSGKTHTFEPTKTRYIRDWLNGSDANSGDHWVEIKVYNGNTQLEVVNVTGSHDAGGDNLMEIVDGNTNTRDYVSLSADEPCYVELDLGEVKTVDKIVVWHYYSDNRTYYDTKTELVTPGIVLDSAGDSHSHYSVVSMDSITSLDKVGLIADKVDPTGNSVKVLTALSASNSSPPPPAEFLEMSGEVPEQLKTGENYAGTYLWVNPVVTNTTGDVIELTGLRLTATTLDEIGTPPGMVFVPVTGSSPFSPQISPQKSPNVLPNVL